MSHLAHKPPPPYCLWKVIIQKGRACWWDSMEFAKFPSYKAVYVHVKFKVDARQCMLNTIIYSIIIL